MTDQLELFSTPAPPAAVEAVPIERKVLVDAGGEPIVGADGEFVEVGEPVGVVLACVAYALGLDCPLLGRFRELGRLPVLADDVKPWSLRGFLLPYVVDPRPTSRWYWWLETMCARRPLRVMPRLDFVGESDKAPAYRNLRKVAENISRARGGAPDLVIEWLAWGLGVAGAEAPRLDADDCEMLYRELNLDLWRDDPADHLGNLLCEYKGRGHDPAAFFPTPMHLVQVMVAMTMGGTGEDRGEPSLETLAKTVHDPCVGTGRFPMAASNWSARISGQDIQRRCVLATLVNGAVYAPWITWPFPNRFFDELAA